MRTTTFLSAIILCMACFSQLNGQNVYVSPQGNYIAVNYQYIHLMVDPQGLALYEIPKDTEIGYTQDEKHFYFVKNGKAYIHLLESGKLIDSIEVSGSMGLKFDNDFKRYIYNSYDYQYIYRVGEKSPFLTLKASFLEFSNRHADVDFTRDLAVADDEKGINIYNLSNPQNPLVVKNKKVRSVAIDRANGNIIVGLDPGGMILTSGGAEISKYKKDFRYDFTAATSKWFIDRGNFGTLDRSTHEIRVGDPHRCYFSADTKKMFAVYVNSLAFYNLETEKKYNTLVYEEIIKNKKNQKLVLSQKDDDLKNSDKIHKIYTFRSGTSSPWFTDGKDFAVRGDKYLFSCPNPSEYKKSELKDESIYMSDKTIRIEAGIKFLQGDNPYFGIYFTGNVLLIRPDGYCKDPNANNAYFTYAVNRNKELNILVLEITRDSRKYFVNGELVFSKSGDGYFTSEFGFRLEGSGLAEADYIMISKIRDESYYDYWRRQSGIYISPQMIPDFQGHSGVITDITVSPDGKEVVTCAKDKTIRVWNIETGHNIRTFRTHTGPGDVGIFHRIAVSPDKKYIAAGGYFSNPWGYTMGHVRFLDYESGKLLHVYDRFKGSIHSLTFSPVAKPFKHQMLLFGSSSGETAVFRYHDIKANIERGFKPPDYHRLDLPFKNTYVLDYRFNPKHDEFLMSMDMWRITTRVEMNNSQYGKEAKKTEIISDQQAFTACYSAGGDSIIIVRPNSIDIYSLKNEQIGSIPAKNYSTDYKVFPTPDGKSIFIRNKLYDIKTGKETLVKTGSISPSKEGIVTPDGIYAFAGYVWDDPIKQSGLMYSAPQQIGLVDLKTGKLITQLKSKASVFEGIAFTPNDMGIVFTKNYSGLEGPKTFQANEIINYFDFEKLEVKPFTQSKNVSNNLILEHKGKKLDRWGIEADGSEDLGKLRYGDVAIRENVDYTQAVAYTLTPDGYVIVGTNFNLILFNAEGKQIGKFVGHAGGVKGLAISHDGKKLLSLGQDRMVKLWDLSQKQLVMEPIASFVFSSENDWICATNENYYASSKYGVKYMGFLQNRGEYSEADFYPFDQFDIVYNRPDIVLSTLGVKNEPLISALNKAYERRLRKVGEKVNLNQKDKRLPYILEISPSQVFEQGRVPFKVKACDGNSKDKMSHFNFWVNDVQIFPKQAQSNESELEVTFDVDLLPDRNVITAQPVSKTGLLGLKRQVTYFADIPELKPNLYILAIGVSEYSDAEMNLRYAAKDAQDMIDQFGKPSEYELVHTKIITNAEATREKILATKEFLVKSNPWDIVMVYFAGHGLLSNDYEWYFATHDIDFSVPEKKGLSYEEMQSLFEGVPSYKRVLLLDACHSGEVDKESMAFAAGGKVTQNVGARGFKSVSKPKVGMDNSFALMQSMFSNLEKGTGAAVISSAGGAEFAFESSEWKNGVFTYSVLEGIRTGKADRNKDKEITVSELRDYVFTRVKELTQGKQNPTSRQENLEFDFRVW